MYVCTLLEVCIQMWSSILTQQSRKLNNTMGKIKTNLLILRTHFWSEQWLSLPRWGHRDRAWRCTIEAFVDRGDSEIARMFIIPLLSSSSVTLSSFELNLVFVFCGNPSESTRRIACVWTSPIYVVWTSAHRLLGEIKILWTRSTKPH